MFSRFSRRERLNRSAPAASSRDGIAPPSTGRGAGAPDSVARGSKRTRYIWPDEIQRLEDLLQRKGEWDLQITTRNELEAAIHKRETYDEAQRIVVVDSPLEEFAQRT